MVGGELLFVVVGEGLAALFAETSCKKRPAKAEEHGGDD